MSRKEALSQFINQIHGRPVVVKLNSGVDYRGKFLKRILCNLVFMHFVPLYFHNLVQFKPQQFLFVYCIIDYKTNWNLNSIINEY